MSKHTWFSTSISQKGQKSFFIETEKICTRPLWVPPPVEPFCRLLLKDRIGEIDQAHETILHVDWLEPQVRKLSFPSKCSVQCGNLEIFYASQILREIYSYYFEAH